MPELPDVEVYRGRLARKGTGRRIGEARMRDADCLEGASRKDLEAALRGETLEDPRRHGKVLFARAGGRWLVMHFGMTGVLATYDDSADEPGHARLILDFEDGGHLAFDNQRKFGWIELTDDPDGYIADAGLGPDALEIDEETLAGRVGASRGMIKPMLMDQEKIAGIGNVYSDEMLFQAGILPYRKAKDLSENELGALFDTMRRVLREAAEAGADPARMPKDCLTPHREGESCPRCGGDLETKKISGRTSRFCPSCQS